MPRVTAIIATYNWSEVLPYSIGSALDQTFTDFELIVAGDRCTDSSAEVVEAYDDPRVKWMNLAVNSRHQYGPNNAAIAASDSDLIAYLGHDDLWLPNHLETLVATLSNRPSIAHASSLQVPPDGAPFAWPSGSWAYRDGEWIAPTTVVHSRSLIDEVGDWRAPWETGLRDPECDLWARMSSALGRSPTWVREMTSVKFPADARRDVYVTRPCHEQQLWLKRIRSGERWPGAVADATRLGRLRTAARNGFYIAAQAPARAWDRQSERLPSWLRIENAEQRYRRRRETKGVDRAPP